LREFKREKILKQNARLSLANAVYDNPSLPRRKIMLSVGGNNYRPPLERSKSAPKLMAIEEAIGEEEGDEIEVITLTTDSRDLQYGSRQEHVGRTGGHDQQHDQLSSKAIRTLTRSLGKLWRRTHSVDISTPDPEFKVSYLGNVLTGWAKGE